MADIYRGRNPNILKSTWKCHLVRLITKIQRCQFSGNFAQICFCTKVQAKVHLQEICNHFRIFLTMLTGIFEDSKMVCHICDVSLWSYVFQTDIDFHHTHGHKHYLVCNFILWGSIQNKGGNLLIRRIT